MKPFSRYIHREGFAHPKAKFLALSAFLFSLGVITSVSTTFAWFTISVRSTIDFLNIKAGVKEGYEYTLKLYLEKSDGELIHNEEGYSLEEMGYDKDKGLNDVSGMFEAEWRTNADPLKDKPKFRRSYGAYASDVNKSTVATDGYLQTVYYLESNENCDVYLDPSTSIEANEDQNRDTAGGDYDKYVQLQTVVNSVRLSFYTYTEYSDGTIDDDYIIAYKSDSRETYYGGLLDMNLDGYYDSRDDKEILYGEYDVNALKYVAPLNESTPMELSERTTFNAHHPSGVQLVDMDVDYKIAKENSVPLDSLKYYEEDPLKASRPIVSLKANEKKRLVVSLYVEGWDKDMTDAIKDAAFNINLSFLGLIKGPTL